MSGSSWTAASKKRACEGILQRVADGESLRSVCRDEQMPALTTADRWMREEYAEQYAHAREQRADALFEEMLDIADNGTNDWIDRSTESDPGAEPLFHYEHVQRSKTRIDTRKWMLGKMQPKKYGDKLDLNHDMSDGLGQLLSAVANNGTRLGDD